MSAAVEPALYRHYEGGLYRVIGLARRVGFEEFEAAVEFEVGRDATDPAPPERNGIPPLVHLGISSTGELVVRSGAWKEPAGQVVIYVSAKDGRWWVRDLAQFNQRVAVNEKERGFEVAQRFYLVGP